MEEIAKWFVKHMIARADFSGIQTIANDNLLFPNFKAKLDDCNNQFKRLHPGIEMLRIETFRNNKLQAHYYQKGASKIAEYGMHYYGIAADHIFQSAGVRTWKGDIEGIRRIWRNNGLHVVGLWDALHVQYIYPILQPALREAVKEHIINFQKEMKLTPDGIIGPKTIAAARSNFL